MWKVIHIRQQSVRFYCPGSTVFMVRVSCSETAVSVLKAIPLCVVASLRAEHGGSFAFCLMPLHEDAVLGPGP